MKILILTVAVLILIVICIPASRTDSQIIKITVVPHPVDANYVVAVGHSVTIFSDANCSIVYNAKSKAAKETVPVYMKIKNNFRNVIVTVK
jgi:hypothetical protein